MIRRPAFTIIELIIYMGLVAILLTVITQLFTSSLNSQVESSSSMAVDQAQTYLLSRFQYDLRRARAILVPAALGETSSVLTLDIGGSTYKYLVNGHQLQLIINNSQTYLLTDSLASASGFQVIRLGNNTRTDSVALSLTLESLETLLAGNSQIRQINTAVSLRSQP